MSEKALQWEIVKCGREEGYIEFHPYDARKSTPGFPDLVMANTMDLDVLFFEVKKQLGKLTPEQQRWGAMLVGRSGVEYRIIRPSDLEWAKARLRAKQRIAVAERRDA